MHFPTKIRVFVGHAFSPKCGSFKQSEFRDAIEHLLSNVKERVGADVDFSTTYEFRDYEKSLNEQLISTLREVDLAVIDLSDNNPNVLFELGFLNALRAPTLILKSRKSVKQGFQMPVDVAGRLYVEYESIADVSSAAAPYLGDLVDRLLTGDLIPRDLVERIWFGPAAHDIHLVCPPSYDQLDSLRPESPNYVHLDNFGDKDALFEVTIFLAMFYRARIIPYTSDGFPARQNLRDNLVVIGGPGGSGLGGNRLSRELMSRIDTCVSYAESCDQMLLRSQNKTEVLEARLGSQGEVEVDFGYFGRFPNPYNPETTTILLHGIHTAGVLGAAQAFTHSLAASQNVRMITGLCQGSLNSPLAFECVFPVEVVRGEVLVPSVSPDRVNRLAP